MTPTPPRPTPRLIAPIIFAIFMALTGSGCFDDPLACGADVDCFLGELCNGGVCELVDPQGTLNNTAATDMGGQTTPPVDMPVATCPDERPTLCDGSCVQTEEDPRYCGGCATACLMGEVCDEGRCVAVDDCRMQGCVGFTWCDEADGACKPGCARDEQCSSGAVCALETRECVCAAGFETCAGVCSKCPDGASVLETGCAGAACVATRCADGFVQCDAGCCEPASAPSGVAARDGGRDVAVAVDPEGGVALVYTADDTEQERVKLVRWDGSRWASQSVGEGRAGGPKAAVYDTSGRLHVVFSQKGQLRYAVSAGSGFGLETIVGLEVEDYGDLAIAVRDVEGTVEVGVAFTVAGSVQYTFKRGNGRWNFEEVEEGGFPNLGGDATGASLAFLDSGAARISFTKGRRIRYARRTRSDSWQVSDLNSGITDSFQATHTTLAFIGNLALLFFDVADRTSVEAYAFDNGWRRTEVDKGLGRALYRGFGHMVIARSSPLTSYAVYVDELAEDVKLATSSATNGVQITRIDDGVSGTRWRPAIGLGLEAEAHIAYPREANDGSALLYYDVVR